MIPARRAVAILVLALAAPGAALAAAPPAEAAPTGPAPRVATPAEATAAAVPRDRVVQDAGYVAAVEREAQRRGVQVHWVNPPERREARTRTLRLRGALPARESCHGRGCPAPAGD